MTAPFQTFQREFAHYLRDPVHRVRPQGVSARVGRVYGDLLLHNASGFLDACFPVCQAVLGAARWQRLCRTFYRDWPSRTPWFREIAREFVAYLRTGSIAQPLPRWLADLAHYEWAELAVDVMDAPLPAHDPQGDLLQRAVLLNPARIDIVSDWPLHRIGPAFRPRRPQPTCLAVFRDAALDVRFTVLNPVSARLLALLDGTRSGAQAVAQLAPALGASDPATLSAHALALLNELRTQGLVLGATP